MPEIFLTEDGTHSIISDVFGVTYHSKHGAYQETKHVFINAGLHFFIEKNDSDTLDILEIGFGTGLNVWATYLENQKLGKKIRFLTYENTPLSIETVRQLNYTEVVENELDRQFFERIHTSNWGEYTDIDAGFSLKKVLDTFEHIDGEAAIDIIYFDAFAPEIQPDLWSVGFFEKMYKILRGGGILTTYCAKGSVKRNLKAAGFEIESIQGPPGKREMTRAFKKR